MQATKPYIPRLVDLDLEGAIREIQEEVAWTAESYLTDKEACKNGYILRDACWYSVFSS